MKLLKDRILKDGIVKPGNILKVDSLLKHPVSVLPVSQLSTLMYLSFSQRKHRVSIWMEKCTQLR